MPGRRARPVTYLTTNGQFPRGRYRWDTPHEVLLAAGLAIRLNTRIGDRSIRYIAKLADLSPQTILNILNGTTWPDLLTIARLENALNIKLWGNEHRKPPPYWRASIPPFPYLGKPPE